MICLPREDLCSTRQALTRLDSSQSTKFVSSGGHSPNGSLNCTGSFPAYAYRMLPPARPMGSWVRKGPGYRRAMPLDHPEPVPSPASAWATHSRKAWITSVPSEARTESADASLRRQAEQAGVPELATDSTCRSAQAMPDSAPTLLVAELRHIECV